MQSKVRAFTLIELLVVIAIIAILAAILFPVFAQAKLSAKKSQDLSNMKQTATGVYIYLNDNDDMFPENISGDFTAWPSSSRLWTSVLVTGPYLKNKDILLSPADNKVGTPAATDGLYGGAGMPLATRPWHQMSFMANSFSNWGDHRTYWGNDSGNGAVGVFQFGKSYSGAAADAPTTSTAIGNPSNVVMFASGLYGYYHDFFGMPTECLDSEIDYCSYFKGIYDTYQTKDAHLAKVPTDPLYSMWRQFNGRSNFAFSDSHAKSFDPGQIDDPKYWLINQ